ncbi:hypothetical protein GNZ13_10890 [Paraburkholderia sp. 5N]|uniref:Lipoprotein n=2 Tax=Paraburkholderia elongata TaxID=2675747 RepID=A0A972SHN7_9BURK|nr:hypothetical protein [Paraburkholderia elongata]
MKNVFERVSVSRAPMALRGILLAVACIAAGSVAAQGLSPYDDINAPENSTRLMPQAARGSEYPTHGDRQAGELNLNPTDPRAQLANGLPNNAQSGGYGSPLAGVRTSVVPPSKN